MLLFLFSVVFFFFFFFLAIVLKRFSFSIFLFVLFCFALFFCLFSFFFFFFFFFLVGKGEISVWPLKTFRAHWIVLDVLFCQTFKHKFCLLTFQILREKYFKRCLISFRLATLNSLEDYTEYTWYFLRAIRKTNVMLRGMIQILASFLLFQIQPSR